MDVSNFNSCFITHSCFCKVRGLQVTLGSHQLLHLTIMSLLMLPRIVGLHAAVWCFVQSTLATGSLQNTDVHVLIIIHCVWDPASIIGHTSCLVSLYILHDPFKPLMKIDCWIWQMCYLCTLQMHFSGPYHRHLVTDTLSQTPCHRHLVTDTLSQTPCHRHLVTKQKQNCYIWMITI